MLLIEFVSRHSIFAKVRAFGVSYCKLEASMKMIMTKHADYGRIVILGIASTNTNK